MPDPFSTATMRSLACYELSDHKHEKHPKSSRLIRRPYHRAVRRNVRLTLKVRTLDDLAAA